MFYCALLLHVINMIKYTVTTITSLPVCEQSRYLANVSIYCKPILFLTTLFCEFPRDVNQFVMINFCDLALYISTPVYFFITTVWQIYWSAARNICYNEAFANLPKNFSHAKKSWFTALSHISLS